MREILDMRGRYAGTSLIREGNRSDKNMNLLQLFHCPACSVSRLFDSIYPHVNLLKPMFIHAKMRSTPCPSLTEGERGEGGAKATHILKPFEAPA